MKQLALKIRRFLETEEGPTAVEYAVMLSMIIAVCFVAITTIGANTVPGFSSAASGLAGS